MTPRAVHLNNIYIILYAAAAVDLTATPETEAVLNEKNPANFSAHWKRQR